MSKYELLLTLHLLAVILWVGGAVTLHILMRRLMRRKQGRELHEGFAELEWLGERFYPVFSIVLIVAGILLVDEAGYEFSQAWISVGFAGWIVSFLIGIGFYGREGKRRAKLVEEEGPDSPAIVASVKRTVTVNSFELSILLLVVIDMTTKPGL
jgi:uncharacterized membrane protein